VIRQSPLLQKRYRFAREVALERRRSSPGSARPAGTPPPLAFSIGGALPAPLLVSRQFSVLAQPYLEKDQEQGCAETERDQSDGQRVADRPTDQRGADRAGDD
jgi:hypothetical protein